MCVCQSLLCIWCDTHSNDATAKQICFLRIASSLQFGLPPSNVKHTQVVAPNRATVNHLRRRAHWLCVGTHDVETRKLGRLWRSYWMSEKQKAAIWIINISESVNTHPIHSLHFLEMSPLPQWDSCECPKASDSRHHLQRQSIAHPIRRGHSQALWCKQTQILRAHIDCCVSVFASESVVCHTLQVTVNSGCLPRDPSIQINNDNSMIRRARQKACRIHTAAHSHCVCMEPKLWCWLTFAIREESKRSAALLMVRQLQHWLVTIGDQFPPNEERDRDVNCLSVCHTHTRESGSTNTHSQYDLSRHMARCK